MVRVDTLIEHGYRDVLVPLGDTPGCRDPELFRRPRLLRCRTLDMGDSAHEVRCGRTYLALHKQVDEGEGSIDGVDAQQDLSVEPFVDDVGTEILCRLEVGTSQPFGDHGFGRECHRAVCGDLHRGRPSRAGSDAANRHLALDDDQPARIADTRSENRRFVDDARDGSGIVAFPGVGRVGCGYRSPSAAHGTRCRPVVDGGQR